MLKTKTIQLAEQLTREGFYEDSSGRRLKDVIDNDLKEIVRLRGEASRPLVDDSDRVEVIMLVIDNDRMEAIEAIQGIFLTKRPFKLTIYENKLNSMNTAKIWNKLIRESTCGYVLLIDSDAIPKNDFINEMMLVMSRNPQVAVVGPVAGDKGVTTVQEMRYHPEKVEFYMDGHISGYCMLFRKSIFDELGYFDEDFVFYGQDSDWIQRVLDDNRYRVFVTPRAWVQHGRNGESSISSKKLEKEGIYDRRIDSEYAQALFEYKKQQRAESLLKQHENTDTG